MATTPSVPAPEADNPSNEPIGEELGEGASADVAVGAGACEQRWSLPPDVRDAGIAQSVGYVGAQACVDGPADGARLLLDHLQLLFPGVGDDGILDCRQGSDGAFSVHAEGRALDVAVPTREGGADNALGDPVANWLVVNAEAIGVQYIIWDRTRWRAGTAGDACYEGSHPHHDHLHVELTPEGAQGLTPFFLNGQVREPAPDGSSPWIGTPCATNADCDFGHDGLAALCYFGAGSDTGVCTLPCEGFCPDRPSRSPSFCAERSDIEPGASGGACLATSEGRACAEGLAPRVVRRHVGQSPAVDVRREVCAPSVDDPDPDPDPDPWQQAVAQRLGSHAVGGSADPARIWTTDASLGSCGSWSHDEDFSSGRYNVHRYSATLSRAGDALVRVRPTAGRYAPAVYIFDGAGEPVFAADAGTGHAIEAAAVSDGRDGGPVEIALTGAEGVLHVYVTSWPVLESELTASIPTDVRYTVSASHDCGDLEPGDLASLHRGLTYQGHEIPRRGTTNPVLSSTNCRNHGGPAEPFGDEASHAGLPYVSGLISHFGGPNDTGVSSTETGAITGEHLRSLNNPLNPSASDLSSRPEDFYYLAMRWAYPDGARPWRSRRFLVVNPRTGAALVARAVDWGPNCFTSRIVDVAPQMMADLGVTTDDVVYVAFADDGAALGPVR